jgi:anaerobic ribonucleoside-triphosphate reductase activating protein
MRALRVSGIVDDSIVDGPGLRLTIFTQGCPHHCEGCHNPQTHAPDAGSIRKVSDICAMIDENPLCTGVTFSGGEPLLQPEPLTIIAQYAHEKGKNTWLFSGYTWEEILALMKQSPAIAAFMQHIDGLVDGRFELATRDLTLLFRGSANQRIIDVPASLAHIDHPPVLLDL